MKQKDVFFSIFSHVIDDITAEEHSGAEIRVLEIAPGIDLQTEVLDQMDFVPAIAPDLKVMDEGIFRENWGELGKYM